MVEFFTKQGWMDAVKPASPLIRGARCRYIESSPEERRCCLCAGHKGEHAFDSSLDKLTATHLFITAVEKARESARVAELDLRTALAAAVGQGAALMVLEQLIVPAVRQEQQLAQLTQLLTVNVS